MKKIILPFALLLITVSVYLFVGKTNYTARTETPAIFKEQIAGAIDYILQLTANRTTGKIDLADVANARAAIQAASQNRSAASLMLNWEEMGPDNVGGRTRALMLDKDSADVVYAGGVAGGLWKSTNGGQTWRVLFDKFESNTVSCIAQAINGDIYVGTGEGHYSLGSFNGSGSGGMIGSGIWKSTNRGASWTRLASTIPSTANNYVVAFAFVNEVATSPLNAQRVYASTNNGLRVSDDGGQTWINPIHTSEANQSSGDVKVGSDGTVIVSIDSHVYLSPNGNDNTFVYKSGTGTGKLPETGGSRVEFAFSAQDPNYIYACMAATNGSLYAVYKSINKGNYWSNISVAGVNPLGSQGTYDNVIAVSPANKDRIFVGGQSFCVSNTTAQPLPDWKYIGNSATSNLHADNHAIVFNPVNPDIMYVGNDGGVYKTLNSSTNSTDGPDFKSMNKGYNVTQYYAIAPTAIGNVVGGTQDNGSKYIVSQGGFSQSAQTIGGGDGGYTEASFLLPNVFFTTVYYGYLGRTFNASFGSSFYSKRIENLPNYNQPGFASFITPISLWESFNDPLSPDSVLYTYKATDNLAVGGVNLIKSQITSANSPDKLYLSDTNKVAHTVGETVKVRDYLQSRIAVGFTNSVWITKDAISESGPVHWMPIGSSTVSPASMRFFGQAKILRFSADGDYLYVGTFAGDLFRFSNLKSITYADTLTGEIGHPNCQVDCKKIASFTNRALCGIAIDPKNNDKVVVTLGNYGHSNYVYVTQNATSTAPSFTSIQNSLPPMPVYDALIDMNNTNNILLGTEYGVWASDDNGASWSQSSGFPLVPVLCLRQQLYPYSATVSSTGIIYAGTHGRGVFKTNSLVGVKENQTNEALNKFQLLLSPNPASDKVRVSFTKVTGEKVEGSIYSLQGKLMHRLSNADFVNAAGCDISTENYDAGTYLIQIKQGSNVSVSKFVVVK